MGAMKPTPGMLAVARHDATRTLAWGGAIVISFSLLSFALDQAGGFRVHGADIAVGIVMVLASFVLTRPGVPDAVVPWAYSALMTALVLALLFEIWIFPTPLAMAYVLLVICAFGPPALSWTPFLVAVVIMVVSTTLVATQWAGHHWHVWATAAVVAAVIGSLLVRVRVKTVGELTSFGANALHQATTDDLTGLLNRRGLHAHLPSLTALSRRLDQPLFVAFVDIDGLKAANDTYGHAFGDQVIVSAAAATVACVRENDLVARWGGDELIVVGLGQPADAEGLSDRIRESVRQSGIIPTMWSGNVSIGMASGPPEDGRLDHLIHEADADMYRRRQIR